jgi:hypothetical protein
MSTGVGAFVDRFDDLVLHGVVFVDRHGFRAALRQLCGSPARRVLAVDGPEKCGKSYTHHLISYVTQNCTTSVARVRLDGEQYTLFGPDKLARKIARLMGRNDMADHVPSAADSSSPAGWVGELCDWLSGAAAQSGGLWMIVLDGFDHKDLPSATKDMVVELVHRSANDTTALRTVLLSYPPQITSIVSPRISYETLSPLTKQDVQDFLFAHATSKNPQVDPADIARVAAEVWTLASNDPVDQMKRLNEELTKWVT